MPDMKYADADIAGTLSDAPDYPQVNFAAVREMHRQVGDLQTERGVATRGLLVRHLVLPERQAGSVHVIDFLADEISPHTAINIMDQYHPCFRAYEDPALARRITRTEFEAVIAYARSLGLSRGFASFPLED